jgi:hypothetical protein
MKSSNSRGPISAMVVVCILLHAQSASAGIVFVKTGDFATGSGIISSRIASADMNRDGRQDVVVLGLGSNSVFVLNGDGTGHLDSAAEYATGQVGSNPQSMVLTDLNGDLYPDVVVGEFLQDKLTFFFNAGDGSLGAPTAESISGQVRPRGLAAGDLNGDGKEDLAVNYFDGRFHGGDFAVWKNDGTGTFPESSRAQIGAGGSISVALEDFNGDSELDAVVTTLQGNIGVAIGNGDGTFQPFSLVSTGTLDQSLNIDVGHFNGDSFLDVVLTDRFGAPRVMFGDGSGTFSQGAFVPVPFNAAHIASGDFDGDGFSDLVTSRHNNSGNELNMLDVFLNDGSGNMTLFSSLLVPTGSHDLALTDFNNDGRLDIASAGADGQVTLFLNSSEAVPEPSSFTLLVLGALGLFGYGRRHQRWNPQQHSQA